MTPRRRLAALVGAGVVPWVVVGSESSVSLVASFGLVVPATGHVTPVWTYASVLTRGLPESLLAWPVASLLYALVLSSAAAGWLWGREDRRLTGGLLVLAGASLLPVAVAAGRPPGVLALPVGPAACWLVAWWVDGDALARMVRDGGVGGKR